MNYSQQDLDYLWQLIKDERSTFVGNYIGLKEFSFDEPLEVFVEKYKRSVKPVGGDYSIQETRVVTDIKAALDILSSVDIQFHHLSCAAKISREDNSALCIHYKKKGRYEFGAVAIPGVNYVPSKETLDFLKDIRVRKS